MKLLKVAMCVAFFLCSGGCTPPCREGSCWIVAEPNNSKNVSKWMFACSILPDKKQIFALTDGYVMLKMLDNGKSYSLNCRGFSFPYDMTVNDKGEIFVADTGNHVIKKILKTGQIVIFAGQNGVAGFRDGRFDEALFQWPGGVAVDRRGGIIVADSGNNAIRRICPDGNVETLAGRAEDSRPSLFEKEKNGDLMVCESRDGGKSVATLRNPIRVAVSNRNHIFILCSALNETHFDNMVRRLDPDGNVVTVAGETHVEAQFRDGSRKTSRLFAPQDIAVDSKENVYVIDDKTIRKISIAGDVSTIAGTRTPECASSRDGRGLDAVFLLPTCLDIDCSDNLYIGDGTKIRQMSQSLFVTTLLDIQGAMQGFCL